MTNTFTFFSFILYLDVEPAGEWGVCMCNRLCVPERHPHHPPHMLLLLTAPCYAPMER